MQRATSWKRQLEEVEEDDRNRREFDARDDDETEDLGTNSDNGLPADEKGVKMVKCKYCKETYKNPSGTSTLTAHMSKHPLQLKPKPKPPIPAWCQQTSAEVSKISTQKQAEATGLLKKWIACSAKPFSTVEDSYFDANSKSLNPAYKARSKRQSYMVITLHRINNEWVLKNIVLVFRYLPVSHTADNTKAVILATLKEHNLQHRILCCTTDGAAAMKAMFRVLSLDTEKDRRLFGRNSADVPSFRICCVAHLVQTVARVATGEKADIVGKVRSLVSFIHRPTIDEEYLEFAERSNLCLPLDVSTRWNSVLNMIEAAFEQRESITNYISTKKGYIIKQKPTDESGWRLMTWFSF
ncbi:hypothetical protein RvY_03993 [Ramazzottius varieornatus]|uniref:BED-type domain-containing protein n=1 Tax=Ramazzottius varieornatus TaxID=947166 RepID=A0A1D1UQ16_RAMVA|nr:hypothetical protein RvY_03993 [Ramazzottius varieornatus]